MITFKIRCDIISCEFDCSILNKRTRIKEKIDQVKEKLLKISWSDRDQSFFFFLNKFSVIHSSFFSFILHKIGLEVINFEINRISFFFSCLQLLQNLGKVDRTADEIFDEHLTNFNRQQNNASRLQKEFNNYIRCIRGMYVASFDNVYILFVAKRFVSLYLELILLCVHLTSVLFSSFLSLIHFHSHANGIKIIDGSNR